MIPKVIHYCWFGHKPLPGSALKCIATWRAFFPDYEIKEWNEGNFDVNIIPYTRQAYAAGKYAFVSDYARFWVLYNYGGLYFDTDVEIIRPMDDIVSRGPFMGREAGAQLSKLFPDVHSGLAVAPGLGLGAEAGMSIYKELLEGYSRLAFVLEDGSLNMTTIVYYTSKLLLGSGLDGNDQSLQPVAGIWIYPSDYFCPMDHTRGNYLRITDNTRSIHHYDASWVDRSGLRIFLSRIKNWFIRQINSIRHV